MEKDLQSGNKVHAQIIKQGLLRQTVLCNCLMNMYVKCGALQRAQEIFQELSFPTIVSWNVLIAGFACSGHAEDAFHWFENLQNAGLYPDAFTYACILKACGIIGASKEGQDIHLKMVREGILKTNLFAGNALLDMYAKCGLLYKLEGVFNELPVRDVVSWTTLIDAFAHYGHGEEALYYFEQMQQENCAPNTVTAVCVLKACALKAASFKGQDIHAWSIKQGTCVDSVELGTALVDMYAKSGMLGRAAGVLVELPARNVVSWTALISGYVQQGFGERALFCFDRMQCENVCPNTVTLTCVLKACTSMGVVYKGQQIHVDVIKNELLDKNEEINTALLDMYAKSGMTLEAQDVFNEGNFQDIACWNALLACYSQLGKDKIVYNLVDTMISQGIQPDCITSVAILNACSCGGLLGEGQVYFYAMSTTYDIIPTSEHYNCMIDLFGSAGQLDKSVSMTMKMPFLVNHTVWRTMLGACKKRGDMSCGMWAFKHAAQFDNDDTAAYVLMSNISVIVLGGGDDG